MHTQTKVLDKNGRVITDKIVPDGGKLHVPSITLMDNKTITTTVVTDAAASNRPRSIPLTDADRERRTKMYTDYEALLMKRGVAAPPLPEHLTQPAVVPQPKPATTAAAPAPLDRDKLYAERDKALSERWRNAAPLETVQLEQVKNGGAA
jgi:hypothetical protein